MRLVALLLVLTLAPLHAAVLREEALQTLWEQSRFEELQRAVQTREGADALVARALLDNLPADKAALERAYASAAQCVREHPQVAGCHYALGSVMGSQAMVGGLLKGISLVGRIREALAQAVALDAAMFEARVALQQTYLIVPAVAGGSVEKARALETTVRDSQPELAKLLRANLAAKAERWDEVERELAGIRLGQDLGFQAQVLVAWSGVVRQWNKLDQHARSRERFTQLAAALPQLATPVYTLGRIAADAGQHHEALRLFDRARGLLGAAGLPIDYRAGIAWMDLGEKDRARALLQRFVNNKRASPSNLSDAHKRLQQLG